MAVYIKGMKMPTSCYECPFLDYEQGFCLASAVKIESGWFEPVLCPGGIKGGRHDDCPLVPVPLHGRLIDADAVMNSVTDEKGVYVSQFAAVIGEAVDAAPTIIPAEEGE